MIDKIAVMLLFYWVVFMLDKIGDKIKMCEWVNIVGGNEMGVVRHCAEGKTCWGYRSMIAQMDLCEMLRIVRGVGLVIIREFGLWITVCGPGRCGRCDDGLSGHRSLSYG